MWKVYKLSEIYAALRDATDEEVPVIRDGMRLVPERADATSRTTAIRPKAAVRLI